MEHVKTWYASFVGLSILIKIVLLQHKLDFHIAQLKRSKIVLLIFTAAHTETLHVATPILYEMEQKCFTSKNF